MLQESENLSTQTLKKMLGKDAKYINFYKTFSDDFEWSVVYVYQD